jgi:hypothetical protein
MNMHNVVRSVITTINPDILITWRQSTGFTLDAATGNRPVPTYTDVTNLRAQVQAQSSQQLKHPDYISQQGVRRDVYMYGDVEAINRPGAIGGDMLIFPEVPGGPNMTWLVVEAFETWPDWCKVSVTLQTDATT